MFETEELERTHNKFDGYLFGINIEQSDIDYISTDIDLGNN